MRTLIALVVCLTVAVWVFNEREGGHLPALEEPAGTTTPARGPHDADAAARLTAGRVDGERVVAAASAPAPPAEPPLVVRVVTRRSYNRDGQYVPDLHVEVGLGDPPGAALAHGVTDDTGHVEIEISREAARAVGTGHRRIWGRVLESGLLRRTGWARLNDTETREPVELRLLAYPGVTVPGRLVDPRGRGIPGKVRALALTARGNLGSRASATAAADGRFDLHVTRPGPLHITADAGDYGTAVLRDFALALDDTPEPIELIAHGPGTVRGIVLDASGAPAAGVDLLILLTELDDGSGSFHVPISQANELTLAGQGRFMATLRTGADGSFDAGGLVARTFLVRARRGNDDSFSTLLTPQPVSSSGGELVLSLHRPHLVVRALDEEGAALEGLELGLSPRWGAARHEWPETPILVVTPVQREVHTSRQPVFTSSWVHDLTGKAAGAGEYVFEVTEGRNYLVGILGPGTPWRPREVLVPAGAGRVETELQLGTESAAAVLTVSVFDHEALPLRKRHSIFVLDARSGLPILELPAYRVETWPARLELPAGPYRVSVQGTASIDHHHGELIRAREHGSFETEITLRADSSAHIDATLEPGARVRLTLVGDVHPEDLEVLQAEHPGVSGLEFQSRQVRVYVVPESGWVEPVYFEYPSLHGSRQLSSLEFGDERTSQLVSPGRYTLYARTTGGRVRSQPVVLVPGKTTPVELHFD